MKKYIVLLGLFFATNSLFADEGMWLLNMLDKLNLQQKGCKLTPEQIYSINHSSLKDAVLGLSNADRPYNFFCTSELVSPQGLLFTNYHCGFDMIQKHTSITNNYIENGFWAMNADEELPNEGILATRVVAMYDVTERVLLALNEAKIPMQDTAAVYDDDNEKEISQSSKSIFEKIIASVTDTCSYGASVKSFFEGNQYFLFIYETFKDVRLVGAPPRSIGKYGDETDNWMWPRHTGDFCVLRVYTDESGMPSEYSTKNKPLSPKHYLPVSLKGVNEGDYAMVLGYPGTTGRYRCEADVRDFLRLENSTVKIIGDLCLDTYHRYMDNDTSIYIKYTAKYDMLSNYWKYSIGQNKGLKNLDVAGRKKQQEDTLKQWILADSSRIEKYGAMLDTLSSYYTENALLNTRLEFLNIGLLNVVESMMFAYDCIEILDAIAADDPVAVKEVQVAIKDRAKKFYKDYDANVDKAQFITLTYGAWNNLGYYIYRHKKFPLMKKYHGDVAKYADAVWAKSVFTDEKRFNEFIEKPDYKKFITDPMFGLLRYTISEYFRVKDALDHSEIDSAQTLYVDAIMKMNPDSLFYPDANSTLRLTYGSVASYQPSDGVSYKYYTTLKGVMEKKDEKKFEFHVPAKLEELYNAKDYGQYADANGELPVCFITTNDITGGNSGSPVINANGELIGLAFDGNWEAMSGDIIYEPILQRTISVDVRYVLFVIDKFAGAGYLLDEMKIVK